MRFIWNLQGTGAEDAKPEVSPDGDPNSCHCGCVRRTTETFHRLATPEKSGPFLSRVVNQRCCTEIPERHFLHLLFRLLSSPGRCPVACCRSQYAGLQALFRATFQLRWR